MLAWRLADKGGLLRRIWRSVGSSRRFREAIWELRAANRAHDASERRRHLKEFRLIFGMTATSVDVQGVRMNIDLRDLGVAQVMYDERDYEPLETGFVLRNLRSGSVFIDIGANIGYFSVKAAKVTGPSGRVIAIEPEPYNFELLRTNIQANGTGSLITALNIALASSEGVAYLHKSTTNFGDHRLYFGDTMRETTVVRTRTLDDVVRQLGLDKIDLIKMDVQGFECHVLEGMREILENMRPSLLTEFWPEGLQSAGGSPSAFLNAFTRAGYRMYRLHGDGLQETSYENVMQYVPERDPAQPDAAYLNLVFIPGL
jgi:FkbM family methyltransferase